MKKTTIKKDDKTILGLIPARKDFRTLPNKNLYRYKGKPLIEYTIECGLQSRYLDRLVVSTEDEEIAELSRTFGAETPFVRPAELSRDDVPDILVIRHAIDYLRDEEDWYPDILVFLRPVYPFRLSRDIDQGIETILSSGCDSVQTVSLSLVHPYFMLLIKDHDIPQPYVIGNNIFEKFEQKHRMKQVYSTNGLADITRTDQVMNNETFHGSDTRVIITEASRALSIDKLNELNLLQ